MVDKTFFPFFERRLITIQGNNIFGKVLVSLVLGLVFLIAQFMSIGDKVFTDSSWFFSFVITNGMLCLYYGMYAVRNLFSEMDLRLRQDSDEAYITTLKKTLSDRNFFLSGLFLGLLTCWVGILFGLPYPSVSENITLQCGLFIAGFIHGMPVVAIYGIFLSINEYSRKAKRIFDFTSPDHCGGMQFIGDALLKFSLLFLLAGVLISVSILKFKWTGENIGWILAFKYFWLSLPYLLSLFALIAPAIAFNKELSLYKLEQDVLLQNHLAEIRQQLNENQLDVSKQMELQEDYKFQQSVREDLHKMRTWPYGITANLKYLSGVIPSLIASVHSAGSWLKIF